MDDLEDFEQILNENTRDYWDQLIELLDCGVIEFLFVYFSFFLLCFSYIYLHF